MAASAFICVPVAFMSDHSLKQQDVHGPERSLRYLLLTLTLLLSNYPMRSAAPQQGVFFFFLVS